MESSRAIIGLGLKRTINQMAESLVMLETRRSVNGRKRSIAKSCFGSLTAQRREVLPTSGLASKIKMSLTGRTLQGKCFR